MQKGEKSRCLLRGARYLAATALALLALSSMPAEIPPVPKEQALASRIPAWYLAAIKRQVLPSPKRIIDVKLDDDYEDSLVVRDRVIVIPKTIKVLSNRTL